MRSSCTLLPAIAAFLSIAVARADELRFPTLPGAIEIIKANGYTEEPTQIPATVIDTGILAYVPYTSYRIGDDREVNIYGDPSNPACVEVGLYRSLVNSADERHHCIALLHKLVPGIDVSRIDLDGGRSVRGDVVAEITPPTAADAYGGWWISIYSLSKLDAEKGTEASVSVVSEPRYVPDTSRNGRDWSDDEIKRSRPSHKARGESSDRVYVRGYSKRDGTYVPEHYRSRRN